MTKIKIILPCIRLLIVSLLIVNVNCSNDSDDDSEFGDTITGTILTPDGSTPIAGATVYIPVSQNSFKKAKAVLETSGCSEPEESYIAYTCTNADGSFILNVSAVEQITFNLRVIKGSFIKDVEINKASSDGNLGGIELPADPKQGGGNFAVVSGTYDRMEDILAKLGMGELNYYMLETGTETFDIYDGNNSLHNNYPVFMRIFDLDGTTDKPKIHNYDMVFINCGNEYEFDVLESGLGLRSVLRNYVEEGGKLYVTDQSYDFVEQVFPEYIDFEGSNEIFETSREHINAAETGITDIESDATINDPLLAEWLGTVSCQGVSCLLDPTTIYITGFWSDWTVITGAHASKSSDVKIWITGSVEYYDRTGTAVLEDKPLTVSFIHGEGKVIYTSYHTREDRPSADFWPQERILQYLVFE